MTPRFSPFLAHLLMAGLARRALLHTDARSDAPPADQRPSSQKQAATAVAAAAPVLRFPRPAVATVSRR
jgi:hypothetical protein